MGKLGPVALSKMKAGFHSDGDNLYLRVKDSGSRSWVFRYKQSSRVSELGLGPFPDISLSEARKLATKMRLAILEGTNPDTVLNRNNRKTKTFKEYSQSFIDSKKVEWRNSKHVQQWQRTLQDYVFPKIGNKVIADINLEHILSVLTPIWQEKTETASRVRGRIESIIDFAAVLEGIDKRNPARWKGNLDKVLPSAKKIKNSQNHPSLSYKLIPEYMRTLRSMETLSAYCLRFLILTGTRSSEARGAAWSEIDLEDKIWKIPAARMKAYRQHNVPLNSEAILILEIMNKFRMKNSDLIFNSAKGRRLSDVALSKAAKRIDPSITVHGFRSSFRVWAAEKTNVPKDVQEFSLAHNTQTETESAYQRSDLYRRRTALMNAWGKLCNREPKIVSTRDRSNKAA